MDTVFIVDDYPLFRRGYAELLDGSPGLSVCGTAASLDEALDAIPQAHPDLVLIDSRLERMTRAGEPYVHLWQG